MQERMRVCSFISKLQTNNIFIYQSIRYTCNIFKCMLHAVGPACNPLGKPEMKFVKLALSIRTVHVVVVVVVVVAVGITFSMRYNCLRVNINAGVGWVKTENVNKFFYSDFLFHMRGVANILFSIQKFKRINITIVLMFYRFNKLVFYKHCIYTILLIYDNLYFSGRGLSERNWIPTNIIFIHSSSSAIRNLGIFRNKSSMIRIIMIVTFEKIHVSLIFLNG